MTIRGDKQGGTTVLGDRLLGMFGQIVTKWSAYGVVGSSLVYALGYLSTRFKLTALGLVTDLDILDERYLFEGFKFLIFLASSVPIVVLMALPIAGLLWLAFRLRPGWWTAVRAWWEKRTGPLVAAICVSVLTIQLVMRQCFRFDNLLLRAKWPKPDWFGAMLTSGHDLEAQSFFAALLAGTALSAAGLFACAEWNRANTGQRTLAGVLAFLVFVQMILLPVNYGVLTSGRGLARLAALPDATPPESRGWLVWEAKEITLLLVRDGESPRLVTFAKDKAPSIQVSGYDFPDDVRRGFAASPTGPDGPTSTRSARRPQPASGWVLLASALGLDASAANVRAPETPDAQAKIRGVLVRIPTKEGSEPVRLGAASDYRSPVFAPDGGSVYALQDTKLVRFLLHVGQPEDVATIPGAIKLLGFEPAHPERLYFLSRGSATTELRAFDLNGAGASPSLEVPADALELLLGEARAVAGAQVFVVKDGSGGGHSVNFRASADSPARRVWNFEPPGARQPSLSPDGKWIAFVLVRSGD